jgi:hypothetical protein
METIGKILAPLLTLAGIILFYVLFPLWASRYAKQHGKDTLATISKFSIFILLGPLGGLIAWLGSASSTPKDIVLPPCPECGSTSVKAEMHTIDSESGEDLGAPVKLWFNAGGQILIGGLMLFLSWGVYTEFLEWVGFTGPVPAVILAALSLGAIVRGVLAIIGYYKKDNKHALALSCNSCKHTWQKPPEPTAAG